MIFRDRADAGARLADECSRFAGPGALVVGIPRGGVPVARVVATRLGAPLDVIVVRKLGLPTNQEVAMGAIGEGVRVVDDELVHAVGVSTGQLARVEQTERAELERRVSRYRAGRHPLAAAGKTVLVVDDGIATGATMRAACAVVRALGAESVVAAVPVAPTDWRPRPGVDADELVCVTRPANFFAVGQWYADFTQTTDDEVRAALR